MSATRVEPAYINGTGASAVPDSGARSQAFYEKLFQLHKDVVDGKNPRLTFTQTSSTASPNNPAFGVAHTHTEHVSRIPGFDIHADSQAFASPSAPVAGGQPTTGSTSTPAKTGAGLLQQKKEPTDDPARLKIIHEARRKLERAIAEYAKAEEPILKNAREIPLNLLALAHAQVAPVSGLKRDSSEESFDEDSYYSSKANSWSTEHTEPQLGQTDSAIVISDEDDEDLYEPPSQVDGVLSVVGHTKALGVQHIEPTNSNGDWEPDWDEEDDYEPPAPAAFGGSGHARSAPHRPVSMTTGQRSAYAHLQQLPSEFMARAHPATQMPTIAVNQIPTPAAPQPSRISPLTTGNLTQTIQTHIGNIQQAQGMASMSYKLGQAETQDNSEAASSKEMKKQKRLARKEAKAAAIAESSKKRKRGATPEKQQDKKGKRRAVQGQQGSPEPYIKPEPTSPPLAFAAFPSQRSSVVHRGHADPGVHSSPQNMRPHSAFVSDQENSPRTQRYADSDGTDRIAMPPPNSIRRGGDSQDLRRVASLQHARRPFSPGQEYSAYSDPRVPISRYDYAETPGSHGHVYRESTVRPSSARPPRSPSPRGADPYDPRYAIPPPRPGQIVTDAYGNRYIAELVPDTYPPPSRRAHPEDYYAHYPPSRRADTYDDDAYRMVPQTRSRAYSTLPEPAIVDRRARAYSNVPESSADLRNSHRASSVHPAAAPHSRENYPDENLAYTRRHMPRYGEEISRAAYTSEHPPVPRAYSVRPDALRRDVLPEYSPARAGSMAPARRNDMAPPPLPIMRARDGLISDDRYAAQDNPRGQYDERRVVSNRY